MSKNKNEPRKELTRVRKAAGRMGGLATVRRYGREYMCEIGRKGAAVFHARYELIPIFQDDFAIVDRETKLTKAFLSGMSLEG